MRASLVAHSIESAAAAARRVLTSFLIMAAICDRAAKAAQTAIVASQLAVATSASGIATGKSVTTAVCSAAAALAQLVAVTATN